MAARVRELRLEDLDAAVALIHGDDDANPAPIIDHRQSLTAHEGERLVGVALCQRMTGRRGSKITLAFAPDADPEGKIARLLLDKALLKARASGLSRLRIDPPSPPLLDPLSDTAWP